MGIADYFKGIFPRGSDKKTIYYTWAHGGAPLFTSFGKDIYLSDFVNNAIERIAAEVAKIDIKSITQRENVLEIENDDLTRLFRFKPNPLQTTSDFLANAEWIRRKKNNVFIYPQYETILTADGREFKRYIALYPLNPIDFYVGEVEGQAWEVRFNFEGGKSYTLPYKDLIHLKWRRGSNTIIGGGDDYGKPNEYSVIRTIDALDKTIQGLPKSIEASLQVKGVYAAKTLADQTKLNKTREDFEKHITVSKSGMIATDLAGEFTPVNIRAADIPDAALKFLKAVIEERYGVSAAILSGDYTGEQHSAFYQTAIEEFIVQFEQAMTAALFTPREQDVGHRIKCYYSKVNYMSTTDKMNLADLATKTGTLTLNQVNEMFGVSPYAGGDVRLRSLNYIDASIANQYQLGGINDKDEEGEEDEE